MNGTTTVGIQAVNCLVFGILQSLVAIMSSLFNGLLLIVFYKNPLKSFRRPFSVLIIGLVATDFLKGFLTDAISAWINFQCAFGRETWLEDDWNFYTVLDYALDNSSTVLIIVFAGDRLVAVTFPIFYRTSINSKKTAIAVVLVWVYALLFSFLQFAGIEDETYDLVDVYLHIVIPLITMIIIHSAIYHFLRKRRQIETASYANQSQETPRWIQKNKILERNFRLVSFVITLVLVVSQLPYLILVIIKWRCKPCTESGWFANYELFADFILCITSAINPLLYCWRLNEYRRAMKALMTCTSMHRLNNTTMDSNGNADTVLNKRENLNEEQPAKKHAF